MALTIQDAIEMLGAEAARLEKEADGESLNASQGLYGQATGFRQAARLLMDTLGSTSLTKQPHTDGGELSLAVYSLVEESLGAQGHDVKGHPLRVGEYILGVGMTLTAMQLRSQGLDPGQLRSRMSKMLTESFQAAEDVVWALKEPE